MNLSLRTASLRRTIIIAVIVVGLAGAAAYALLQARGVLTGNTISTASANLVISTDGRTYLQSMPGFSFDGVVPGGYPAPAEGYPLYVKNIGTTPLDLRLALNNTPSNPDALDLNKFSFTVTGDDEVPKSFTLVSLANQGQSLDDELPPGATRQYMLRAQVAEDAGQSIMVSNIDLALVGIPRDPNDPNQ